MGNAFSVKCLIFSSFIVFFTACGGARPDAETPSDGAASEFGSGCIDDGQCPVDFVCTDEGACIQDGLRCSTSDDCDVGLLCEEASGTCVECLSNDTCPPGEVCVGGACEEPSIDEPSNGEIGSPDGDDGSGFGCSSDSDCSYGVCDFESGYCVDCRADLDCPGDYLCDGGYCVEGESSGPDLGNGGGLPDFPGQGDDLTPCESQADCDASCTVCNPASGMCESCSDTLACGEGLSCVDPGASLGFEVGTLCLEDANNPLSGLACFGGTLPVGGSLPGFP